jgi:uncharacterized iron-regulated membrane protein
MSGSTRLYRTIWRWHFYAGLFVIPFVVILSLTGAAYLFKPQVERWEERAWRNLPTENAASPSEQRDAALAAFPGASFVSYRLPQDESDAVLVHLALPAGMRDVFVSPQGKVMGSLDPDARLMELDQQIHGQLLVGKQGSWLVELAASWAIVLIVTGLYLWWPRGRGLAGVAWPRLHLGPKAMWRDLHAVTGFWVSGLALVLLVTGLPWADAWGSAFKNARAELGWVKGKQDWTIGGKPVTEDQHAGHDHAAMMHGGHPAGMDHADMGHNGVSLNTIVARAKSEHLAFPVLVQPPKDGAWTVKSDSQNRPLRITIRYDARTGHEASRETFADKHPVDRVIGYGIAWHEGQLFGWINHLIGVLTAAMLLTLAVSGFVMWRRSKPSGELGAPRSARAGTARGAWLILLVAGLFLPLLALSLATIALLEWAILPRLPRLAGWLGVPARG